MDNREAGVRAPDETLLYEGDFDTDNEAQGYDPATGSPIDVGSNWLGKAVVEPAELGEAGNRIEQVLSPEDREDNGQAGPTQENGGIGLGDESGLGMPGLTEAGEIGAQEHDAGGSLDRVVQRMEGPGDFRDFEDSTEDPPSDEPELRRDQLDTMIPPMYAEPNDLDTERSESRE